MTPHADEAEQVSAGLRKVLNLHGHGFHYAILRHASQMSFDRESSWRFDVAEFPVVAGNKPIHIDFVFRSPSGQTCLVAECKRVDPARGRWCFARAPYTWRNPSSEVIFDQFICQPPHTVRQEPCVKRTESGIYQLGIELKTGIEGDGTSQGGSTAIDKAVTQVLRGTSGLVNHLFKRGSRSYGEERVVRFVPTVFTTAELWVTEVDLGAADLTTGDLTQVALEAKKAPWIWHNYNRSPDLRHDLEWSNFGTDLTKELKYESARSIAIVSPEGISYFLRWNLEEWLEP